MSTEVKTTKTDGGKSETLPAAGLIAAGIYLLVSSPNIAVPPGEQAIGPRFFPYVVGAGLVVVGSCLLIAVLRGDRAEPEDGEDVDADSTTDWKTLGLTVALLVGYVLIINPVGYLLSTIGLFGGLAWVLGARNTRQLVLISIVVPLVVYLVFTRGLGVYLPNGLLEAVI